MPNDVDFYNPPDPSSIRLELLSRQQELWDGLVYQDQLNAFCYVCRILSWAIEEKIEARDLLYNKLNFGLESYGASIDAGLDKILNTNSREK